MTLEEFCQEGLLEDYSRISSGDDGDMRIDVDFTDKDDFSHQISFIANIFEISYDDLLDDLDDFEQYELEEFDSPIYFINAGSFAWSSNYWEELLNDYYFSFESLIEAVKSKLELFINELFSEDKFEYDSIHISNCTSQDSDATESDLDSFVESLSKNL